MACSLLSVSFQSGQREVWLLGSVYLLSSLSTSFLRSCHLVLRFGVEYVENGEEVKAARMFTFAASLDDKCVVTITTATSSNHFFLALGSVFLLSLMLCSQTLIIRSFIHSFSKYKSSSGVFLQASSISCLLCVGHCARHWVPKWQENKLWPHTFPTYKAVFPFHSQTTFLAHCTQPCSPSVHIPSSHYNHDPYPACPSFYLSSPAI